MKKLILREDDEHWSSKRREELLAKLKKSEEKISSDEETESKDEIDPSNLTVGQLKELIKDVKLGKISRGIKNFLPTGLIKLVKFLLPKVGAALTLGSLVKLLVKKPSIADAVPVLKGLAVDESISQLVDDNIENSFLADIEEIVNQLDDGIFLSDLNMTKMFLKYIKENFNIKIVLPDGTTNENIERNLLRRFIRETIRK